MPNWFVSSWGSHLWDKPRIGHLPNRSTYLCGSKWDDLEAGAAFFCEIDEFRCHEFPEGQRVGTASERVGAGVLTSRPLPTGAEWYLNRSDTRRDVWICFKDF